MFRDNLTFLSWAWTQLYFRHLNFRSFRKGGFRKTLGKEKERISSLPTTRTLILSTTSRKRCFKDLKRMILFTSHKLLYNFVNTMGPIGSGRWHSPFFIQELCPFLWNNFWWSRSVIRNSLLLSIPILFSSSIAEGCSGMGCSFLVLMSALSWGACIQSSWVPYQAAGHCMTGLQPFSGSSHALLNRRKVGTRGTY